MYLFRGEPPLKEMAETMPGFMRLGFKVFGRRFFPAYPFEEAYFLETAKRFRDNLEIPLMRSFTPTSVPIAMVETEGHCSQMAVAHTNVATAFTRSQPAPSSPRSPWSPPVR